MVSVWQFGRRALLSADASWMAEDLEMAPDWLREEMKDSTEDLQVWLSTQGRAPGSQQSAPVRVPGRRGRKPRK